MLEIACDGVLGTDSKYEKNRMTSFRGAGRALIFFRDDFPNLRTEDRASKLVSK